MSRLADYLEKNRDAVYAFAAANTNCNADGHAVISKGDEWAQETEWDELFEELSGKN